MNDFQIVGINRPAFFKPPHSNYSIQVLRSQKQNIKSIFIIFEDIDAYMKEHNPSDYMEKAKNNKYV